MELEHTFVVPATPDEAFRILRDVERIGPCFPGATIESVDGDELSGKVTVKMRSIQVTYRGTAVVTDIDEAARSATIEATGEQARGSGTVSATIRTSCVAEGDATAVRVVTELAVTGRLAQFGREVMAEAGDRLLDRLADCLATALAEDHEPVLEDRAPDAAADGPAEGQAVSEAPADGAPVRDVPAEAPQPDAAGPDHSAPETPDVTETAERVHGVEPGGWAATVIGGSVPRQVGAPAVAAAAGRPALQRRTDDAIDLLDVAGGAVVRRAAPVAAALALLALVVWLLRRG